MLEEKIQIEKIAKALWQGKGADIASLSDLLDRMTQKMLETIKKISEQGIEFPVQYIMDAMKHTADSIQNRDDYKLADCLIYEWLEIITVYEEVVMECK